ncbi:unnamed protein product [Durusdinium trenchii]|uniref:Exostosin GT47 domain-containing protein n=1 Tax=Durusdinium trenchii TaxID=1381693 RepID=A0ABP0PK71_9DINO
MAGNAACWRGGFSFTTCCAAGGNPECFDSIYTYEVCCLDTKNVNALPQDCRTNEDVASSPRKAQCRGTFGVTKDDWDHFFLAHQLSQALGTSYKGWPDLMALWQKVNVSSASLEAAEEDCAFGVVALLLQSLPSIEKLHGSLTALRGYRLAYRILGGAAGSEDCRWNDMVNHALFGHLDLLMGTEQRFHFCPEGAPKIYVYDKEMKTDSFLSCARTGFWASEVYLDRFFRQSKCRTHDPEKAELFFVPAYLTCWELQFSNPLARQQRLRDAAAAAAGLPFLRRREGLDHVMLFGASAWQLPGWRELFGRSVLLAVESEPIESDGIPEHETHCWHCKDCFQPWKDLVVPPLTPLPAERSLLAKSKPMLERKFLMAWHGQHAESTNPQVRRAYVITNETVRTSLIQELSHLSDVSLGSPVSDYAGIMGNAKFCLCPKGASSYTSRVFEALFAGCVPVILSDHVRLPFDGLVNWTDFSIAWPMEYADLSLYNYLKGLWDFERPKVLAMQAKAQELRCWFDYFALEQDPKDCSPYLAVLLALRAKVAHLPRPRRVPVLRNKEEHRCVCAWWSWVFEVKIDKGSPNRLK